MDYCGSGLRYWWWRSGGRRGSVGGGWDKRRWVAVVAGLDRKRRGLGGRRRWQGDDGFVGGTELEFEWSGLHKRGRVEGGDSQQRCRG
ncbi:hypothetical protein DCAR_0414441 [Daucus carota subsp. sativus]|uniref:Uncharacterized protein n=1 Tax=Daucus carota subsp. sativus TaxID=79200 RepID=A0A175YA39_DAUCS|nr:hypothetical protein DCAR_0414441 [Daucus carota subsp. sativus]